MNNQSTPQSRAFDPSQVTQPDPTLLTYYIIVSLITVVGFPILMPLLYCKYRTLRYRFDDEGVSMSYGLLFRREIYLTYRRIQDIHVTRGIIQRKLGLATVSVQTASGSAGAEMAIEGIRHPEALRDFLYTQMRGARGDDVDATDTHGVSAISDGGSAQAQDDEVTKLLVGIRNEVVRLRETIAESRR